MGDFGGLLLENCFVGGVFVPLLILLVGVWCLWRSRLRVFVALLLLILI